jgi:hypothetical protein
MNGAGDAGDRRARAPQRGEPEGEIEQGIADDIAYRSEQKFWQLAVADLELDQLRAEIPTGMALGNRVRGGIGLPKSQHSVAEEGVIERQKDDSADDGGTGAVNAADVETRHAGPAKKVE